jgi:hypothetical protein
MGSVSLNVASSRRGGRRLAWLCSSALLNLLVLLSLLSTNLLALRAFLSPRAHSVPAAGAANLSSSAAISAQVAAIAREIDATRLVPRHGGGALPPELLLFLSPHALPLGRDARTGLTHMPASVAHACFRSPPTLALLPPSPPTRPTPPARGATPRSRTASSPRPASRCPAAAASPGARAPRSRPPTWASTATAG